VHRVNVIEFELLGYVFRSKFANIEPAEFALE
jgi:hypothetical protein